MLRALGYAMLIGFVIYMGWFYYDCTTSGGTPVRGLVQPFICIRS